MVAKHYVIDGESYPRVTAVCAVLGNDYLAYWRGRIGNDEADRVSREATGLGTRVHRAVEQYAKRRTCAPDCACGNHPCADWWVGMEGDVSRIVAAYVEWHTEHVRAVVASEKLVVSRLHRFAGTADLVAILDDDDHPTVVDVKTSNSISDAWGLQLAAYQLALEEEGIECGRRVIVQLPSKEPGVHYAHDLADHERDQRAFLNALRLWKWRDGLKKSEPQGPRIRFGRKRGSDD